MKDDYLIMNYNGSLGFGMTNPSAKLHIVGKADLERRNSERKRKLRIEKFKKILNDEI